MDYEKAYKDALERARKINSGEGVAAPPDWTVYEVIFPELKESEDERIRKVLIDYFKSYREVGTCGAETFNGIPTDNILAWLEKQGESKLAGCEEDRIRKWLVGTIKQIPDSSIEWETISKSDVLAWLENQGKQKPAIDFRAEDWCVSKVDGKIHNIYNSEVKQKPQRIISAEAKEALYDKPKWSNDDEQYLLVCKNALRKYQVSDKWDADIISKWLEDKLKQGEQKPAWSEEDELIALSIEHVMNCASLLNIVPEKVDKIRTWIKSLKQRMEGKV